MRFPIDCASSKVALMLKPITVSVGPWNVMVLIDLFELFLHPFQFFFEFPHAHHKTIFGLVVFLHEFLLDFLRPQFPNSLQFPLHLVEFLLFQPVPLVLLQVGFGFLFRCLQLLLQVGNHFLCLLLVFGPIAFDQLPLEILLCLLLRRDEDGGLALEFDLVVGAVFEELENPFDASRQLPDPLGEFFVEGDEPVHLVGVVGLQVQGDDSIVESDFEAVAFFRELLLQVRQLIIIISK